MNNFLSLLRMTLYKHYSYTKDYTWGTILLEKIFDCLPWNCYGILLSDSSQSLISTEITQNDIGTVHQ